MKRARTFISAGLVSAIGFLVAWWCVAQTDAPAKKPVTGGSSPALDRLTALVSHLETNKQTDALKLFYEFSNASLAQQQSADIGVTLHVLMALREGRTTNAIDLLEGRLATDVIGFAASFRELPEQQQEWLGLRSLSEARCYREKFPHKHRYENVDVGVAQAFQLLDNKTLK